jgi:ribosome recycling factor
MLTVQPFDASNMKAMRRAQAAAANLGLNPASQGKFIRIVLPDLSAERRQEFVKICKKMAEDGRVAIRKDEHRQAMDLLKKAKNDGTSDDVKGGEAEVQKLTDQYIAKVDAHLVRGKGNPDRVVAGRGAGPPSPSFLRLGTSLSSLAFEQRDRG